MEPNCGDLLDDDCDGAFDCTDSDCALAPSCAEVCDNQMDDADADTLADCLDAECDGEVCGANGRRCFSGTCTCPGSMEMCNTGDDDDCDGLVDCEDPDCAMVCGEVCNNNVDDNDADTLADCADTTDCPEGTVCGMSGERCSAQTCICLLENCTNGLSDDCDIMVDCADSDCFAHPACTGSGVITSFEPAVATRTGRVRIIGSGFTGVNQVWIGNVPHLHSVDSNTSITIPVVQEGVPLGDQTVTIFKAASSTTVPGLTVVDLLVKQLDAQTSSPSLDFLQLQIGIPASVSLQGYVVTFFNGDGPGGANRVASSFPLTGTTTPAGTYLIAGETFSVVRQQTLPFIDISGGTRAIAIHQSAVPFPPLTEASITGLIDALVYDGSIPDPPPTLKALFMNTNATISEGVSPNDVAIHRCGFMRRDAGQYQISEPTPDYMSMVGQCVN